MNNLLENNYREYNCFPRYESIALNPTIKEYFNHQEIHTRLLQDKTRLQAFRNAIFKVVKPESIVMDIGAGTGILTQFALEAGASKVYAVEENPQILKIAKSNKIIRKYKEKVLFFPINSLQISNLLISPKPDVILSETLGTMAFNEGILITLKDARRFAKKDTIFLPSNVKLMATPCNFINEFKIQDFFLYEKPNNSIRYSNNSKTLFNLDLSSDFSLNQEKVVEFDNEVFNFMCFWFSSKLSNSHSISNSPFLEQTSWGQAYIKFSSKLCSSNLTISLSHENTYKKKFLFSDFRKELYQLRLVQKLNKFYSIFYNFHLE